MILTLNCLESNVKCKNDFQSLKSPSPHWIAIWSHLQRPAYTGLWYTTLLHELIDNLHLYQKYLYKCLWYQNSLQGADHHNYYFLWALSRQTIISATRGPNSPPLIWYVPSAKFRHCLDFVDTMVPMDDWLLYVTITRFNHGTQEDDVGAYSNIMLHLCKVDFWIHKTCRNS